MRKIEFDKTGVTCLNCQTKFEFTQFVNSDGIADHCPECGVFFGEEEYQEFQEFVRDLAYQYFIHLIKESFHI